MPVFRIENEVGEWLTNMALNEPSWKPGDAIYRGRETLEVIDVRHDEERTTLVVKGHVLFE